MNPDHRDFNCPHHNLLHFSNQIVNTLCSFEIVAEIENFLSLDQVIFQFTLIGFDP